MIKVETLRLRGLCASSLLALAACSGTQTNSSQAMANSGPAMGEPSRGAVNGPVANDLAAFELQDPQERPSTQALLEGAHYNKDGQLVTASYMDYTMPRADDLPSFAVGMTSTPCPSNPLGIKGCGEAGAIAAPPAVINAITDALGHENISMPATPQRVWQAVQQSQRKLAAE